MEKSLKTLNTKPRDYQFDNIKAFLILLVVFGHILNIDNHKIVPYKTIYIFIYMLHMPAFIFIAGYFSKNVDKCRDTAFSKYLVLYFILDVLCYVQMYIQKVTIGMYPEQPIVFRLFSSPTGCWYILAMFIWKLLIKDFAKIRFIMPSLVVFGMMVGFTDEFTRKFTLSRLAVYSFFFMLGFFTKKEHIEKIRKAPKLLSVIVIVITGIISYIFAAYFKSSQITILFRGPYASSHMMQDIIIRATLYIISPMLIFAIFNLMPNKKMKFTNIGQCTLVIYIGHLLIDRFLDTILAKYNVFPEGEFNLIFYLLYVLVTTIIIIFIFSRQVVQNGFNNFLKFVDKIIYKEN